MLPKTSYQNSSSAFCSCSVINEIQLCILGGCDLSVSYGEKRPGITGRYVTEDAKGPLRCGSPGITLCSCGPYIVGLKAPYERKQILTGILAVLLRSQSHKERRKLHFVNAFHAVGVLGFHPRENGLLTSV